MILDQEQSLATSSAIIRKKWSYRLHLDIPLFSALLLLLIIGVFVLYSATGQNMAVVNRQLIHITIAIIAMLAIAQVRPRTIQFWAPWLFIIGVILLVIVLLVGDIGKGAQRWLNLGFFRFQPSEILKLALPMMLAWYISEFSLPPSGKHILTAVFMLTVPTLLVAKQPDLGTALLIASAGFFVLLLAGLSWKIILGVLTLIVASAPLIWSYVLHDYQRGRILTLLNPESDPLGAGYHIIQSTIAIGSGSLYGKGWLNGTQSHLDFLPERSTDFIFAVFSEEFGFTGCILLLVLYLYIIARGLVIANQAQDTFSRLLAGSLTLTFFVYIFVNIGMVSGILPVVGVPLPLISYGGTSIVTLMMAFGILMSIQTHRRLIGN